MKYELYHVISTWNIKYLTLENPGSKKDRDMYDDLWWYSWENTWDDERNIPFVPKLAMEVSVAKSSKHCKYGGFVPLVQLAMFDYRRVVQRMEFGIFKLSDGWETLSSSLAPHWIGNMNTPSSLAPS